MGEQEKAFNPGRERICIVPPDDVVVIASPVVDAELGFVTRISVEVAIDAGEMVKLAFARMPLRIALLLRP
jgi:hypothetical protein